MNTLFDVRIFDATGHLKQIIPAAELSAAGWKRFKLQEQQRRSYQITYSPKIFPIDVSDFDTATRHRQSELFVGGKRGSE